MLKTKEQIIEHIQENLLFFTTYELTLLDMYIAGVRAAIELKIKTANVA